MENARVAIEKNIEIKTMFSRKTGLFLAVSEELSGFSVFGKSIAELEELLPAALRDHFDMLGYDATDVRLLDLEANSVFRSLPASICAQALLTEKPSRDAI